MPLKELDIGMKPKASTPLRNMRRDAIPEGKKDQHTRLHITSISTLLQSGCDQL
jgi:hypothetical protein